MTQQEKKAARKRISDARKALSAEQREAMSEAVCARLWEHPAVQKAQLIFSYRAFAGEVDLSAFHEKAREKGKRLAFPVSLPDGIMEVWEPQDDTAWQEGKFGILSPDPSRSRRVTPEELDLVLAPCVGFDETCMRMGWGGGYYDRYLPQCVNACTIAVAYELQKMSSTEPEPWDVALSAIATEQSWYGFRSQNND